MERKIAILNYKKDREHITKELIDKLMLCSITPEIYVFTKESVNLDNVKNITLPEDINSKPKAKNYIVKYFKDELKFDGYLHVLEDNIKILKSPETFIKNIENAMEVLNYNTWFSTVTDDCNFVYKKYNPRIRIQMDHEDCKKLLTKQICFTSHSNMKWSIFNLGKCTDDLLYLNESFVIPMFYIIEYFARRKNNKKEKDLYFMNLYMTIEDEYKVFETASDCDLSKIADSQWTEDDKTFRALNIDYKPESNIDKLLENLYTYISE